MKWPNTLTALLQFHYDLTSEIAMMLTVPITPDIEAKLRERAAALGRDVTQYAAELIRRGVTAPTLDELLDPIRQDFASTGMSDDEIMELGRSELDSLRAEKNSKST